MKRLFMFLLIGLFMISLTSAFEFDNTYDWNEQDRTAVINNCDFWMFTCWNDGEVLVNITHTSEPNEHVPRGNDTLIGEFNMSTSGDFDDVFEDMFLINMSDGKSLSRGKQYKYKKYKNISVDDYKTECNIITATNGTETQECYDVEVGSHIETVFDWKPISNPNEIFYSNITYEIGIFVDVEKGDWGDWQPKILGVTIVEMAQWTEDLNVGILLYYNLDDDLATTNITDFFGGNNGTIGGGDNSEDISTTGKIDKAINFSGVDKDIESNGNSGVSGNQNWTESFWVKFPNTDAETASHFLTYFGTATPNDDAYVFMPSGTTDLRIGANGVGASTITSKTTDWQHIVITYNGTTIQSYVNGTIGATLAASLTITASHLALGSKLGTNYVDDAIVDEYGLWDRVLTAGEISDLFNNFNGITPPSGGGSSSISISTPTIYRMYQRDNDTDGEIYIEGTFSGSAAGIEGSFNGGTYQTFNASPSGGVFSGFINGSVGNGILTIRFTNETTTNDTVNNIGVGDIFLVVGQSNNVGHGDTNNVFNTSNGFATMYQANDNLALLSDPTDSTAGDGSAWPIAANYLMNSSDGLPVMFITAAVGGTAITTWKDGAANHNAAVTQVNEITDGNKKIAAVLFFQGETDIIAGTSYASYTSDINSMANGFTLDLDIRNSVIVGQIDHTATFTRDNVNTIRRAQRDSWLNNSNISKGPITHDIFLSSGGAHFEKDQEMGSFAYRWFKAINRTSYGDSTLAPTIDSITFDEVTENITLVLNTVVNEFSIWNSSSTAISEAFLFHYLSTVYDSSDISSMTISGNEIEIDLTPSINLSYDVTFGGGYDAYGESIPRTSSSLPLDPTWNVTMVAFEENISITLNAPVDDRISPISLIDFNCSANITGGETLINMSLYTNQSGVWEAKNTTIISTANITNTLIHYYELDEASGTIVDSIGSNNGSYNGALYSQTGKINKSIGFDGISDVITFTQINLTDNFTINFWVKPDSVFATNWGQFLGLDGGATIDRIIISESNELRVQIDTANSYNFPVSSHSGVFKMYTLTRDGAELTLYINGVLIDNVTAVTNTFSIDNLGRGIEPSAVDPFGGDMDEVGIWEFPLQQEDVTRLYNSNSGIRPFDITSSTQVWNREIDNSTLWTCQACNSNGDCGFADENRTVSLNINPPEINASSPVGTLDYNFIGGVEFLNVTFTDSGLDTCWYDYNGTNITIDGCISGIGNFTNFTLEEDNFNMTIYANDSTGNFGSSFIEWDYKVLEISQTYNNVTTEGATETFRLEFNKSSSIQVSTVSLFYDGDETSIPYSVSANNVVASGSVTIPIVASEINKSFYWNITLDDGSNIITISNNQTILNVNLDDCSVFTNLIYNFTQYDEENKSMLSTNNTIELQINLYDTEKTSLLSNFSDSFNGVNPVQFCSEDQLLPTVNYSSYVIVKYFVNSTASNQSYSVEYYNILNQTIGNSTIPKNIALYNLKSDDTTKFRLTFRDDEYVLAPNILVQVHRQYIADNDFKIVEIPLTDSNGQAMLNLVKDTVIYNFIMVNEIGEVVGTFNSIAAFCSDFSIGDCTINLAPDSLSDDAYDYNEEFDISISDPSYDNSTERISISFITGDLTSKEVSMNIVRNNDFGNRSVCSASLFAASGVLSCDVSSITDTDQFLFISTFVDDDLAKQDTTNLNADILNFGTLNGAFYAFLLILFLITLFMDDRKALVVSLGLGWISVISLGLVNGKLIGFTSAGIWILISIAIFLWKLNKEDSI